MTQSIVKYNNQKERREKMSSSTHQAASKAYGKVWLFLFIIGLFLAFQLI